MQSNPTQSTPHCHITQASHLASNSGGPESHLMREIFRGYNCVGGTPASGWRFFFVVDVVATWVESHLSTRAHLCNHSTHWRSKPDGWAGTKSRTRFDESGPRTGAQIRLMGALRQTMTSWKTVRVFLSYPSLSLSLHSLSTSPLSNRNPLADSLFQHCSLGALAEVHTTERTRALFICIA